MPASAVTERTSTTHGRCGSRAERAGSADSFALDPSGFVALTWPRDRGPEQIPCADEPTDDGTGARETGERRLLSELVGRVVEDLPAGPAMANWLASVTPGSQDGSL